jgi:SpoIID/LytB domain protein
VFERRIFALWLVLALTGACTSASESASSGGTPAVTSAVTPSSQFSGTRVSVLPPPNDGWFLVRATYPKSSSRCKHVHRATLQARYPGTLSLRSADDGTLSITVTLPFERYLEGIAEVPPTWPAAVLEAQAIAARSYALSHIGWTGQQGEALQTPICATSDCQVYGGIPVPVPRGFQRWAAAVQRTQGQVLLYGDRPADTVYFSTSNGHTYGNEQVFGSSPLPYLRPVIERDDGASPTSHWRVVVPFRDLSTFLSAGGIWQAGARISSVRRSGSTVRVSGGGASRSLDVGAFRDTVNTWASCLMPSRYPTAGLPTTIPSDWYDVSSGRHGATVTGRGWGHGVGMVQWGAYGKARRGWSADRILAFYYGGLKPTRYPEPGLIHVVVASGLRSLTLKPSASGAKIDAERLGSGILHVTGDGALVTVRR